MDQLSTPGQILQTNFIEAHGLSQNKLAKRMGIPSNRINEIVRGKRAITADTALRLGRVFDNGASFWLMLQNTFDMTSAIETLAKNGDLERIEPLKTATMTNLSSL
jgi:antitoxin HigA-1